MSDSFLPLLASAIEAKRDNLLQKLAAGQDRNHEFAELIRRNWHALPTDLMDTPDSFAVDGSSFSAGLADGSTLIIGQAVLLGNGGAQARAVAVECVPSFVATRDVELYADALVRKLELDLALANLFRCAGRTLYLDGSIYQNITQAVWAEHLRVRLELEGADLEEFRLVDRVTNLIRQAPEHQVRLVGIAKTYQSALLRMAFAPDTTGRIGDATALNAWTDSAGSTTPLLLGQVFLDADTIKGRSKAAQAAAAARVVMLDLPAVVAFYLRFERYGLPVRVEALASDLGRSDLLADLRIAPTSVDLVPLFEQLFHDYIDDHTYNVPLVAADLEVRLHQAQATQQYVPIIGERLGLALALNRSRRRFLSLVS